jgi:hypothetical protein
MNDSVSAVPPDDAQPAAHGGADAEYPGIADDRPDEDDPLDEELTEDDYQPL